MLSAANLMVTRDPRFKLVDGYNLQISEVRIQDAGDYVCQIGDLETREQVHTLEILGKLFSSLIFVNFGKCHVQFVLLLSDYINAYLPCESNAVAYELWNPYHVSNQL